MKTIRAHYINLLCLIAIFALSIFLHFYKISDIPGSLYPDESAIGYNAYSVLLTGKDEYGQHLPFYFRSFDDYKMPVYIYATVATIKAFGVNAFAVRFTSALFGSLTIVGLYLLILTLSGKKGFAAIAAVFLLLNPWHLFFSRTGYEVNVATSLLVFGTLFFILGVKRKNNIFLFVLAILSFLIALYTYNVTRLVAPMLFLGLIIFYWKSLTLSTKKLPVFLCLLFILGMVPFFATYAVLQHQPGFAAQQDALITGKVVKADILQTRSYFLGTPSIVQKVLFNYWVLLFWHFIANLITFFSAAFFFLIGADHPHENIGGFGMFYYADFPLIIFGAYEVIKKKVTNLYFFFWWFLCMLFVGGLIVAVPHDNAFGTREYSVVIPLIIFSAYGFYSLLQKLLQVKNTLVKVSILSVCIIFLSYSYLFYFMSYFIRFPIEYAKEWRTQDKALIEYVRANENKYQKIVFDDTLEFAYTSFLFYGKYPPAEHQKEAVYQLNGLVEKLVSDGKYEFRKIDFGHEMGQQGTPSLFITNSTRPPEKVMPLAIFSYPTRPFYLYAGREIGQYPITDIAYEVFSSDEK